MHVEKIDHIHVYVKQLERAIEFFSEVFGLRFSDIIDIPQGQSKISVEPLGIDLAAPTSPDSPVSRMIEKRGEGIGGISFKVPNLDEAVSEMISRGIRPVGRIEEGRLKEVHFHPKDCFGIMIELIEYKDEHGTVFAYLNR